MCLVIVLGEYKTHEPSWDVWDSHRVVCTTVIFYMLLKFNIL